MSDDLPDLGPCCMCEGRGARNLLMLDQRGLIAGHGWGCLVCGLPPDGAYAVLCDECMDEYRANPDRLTIVCRGYPSEGRVALAELPKGVFEHDMRRHAAEHSGVCRVCGCTDDRACPGGCFWVEDDLCSRCVARAEP